jgi:SRSO17 transposase
MLDRALDAGVPATWVTADEVYGGSPALREWLEERHTPYALAIRCTELLAVQAPDGPADARASAEQLAAGVPAEQWIACSAGHGAKGRRLCDWTRIELASPATSGMARWLLLRRRTDGELAFYACYGLAATPLVGLVRVAGTRWAVEEGFQQAKGRSAWTTTRSASGQAGTATPPLRCWRTRSWPSPAPRPAAPSGQRGDTVA